MNAEHLDTRREPGANEPPRVGALVYAPRTMSDASILAGLARAALVLLAASAGCGGKGAPASADGGTVLVGGGTNRAAPPAASAPRPAATDEAPACAKDDDCQPTNCCFALKPESCVPRARTRCDAFELKCEAFTAPHYVCACVKGACTGNPAARSEAPEVKEPTWARGALKPAVVLDGIIKHGPDVKACLAQSKNANGTVSLAWSILPTGKVEKVAVLFSSLPTTKGKAVLPTCLAKKVGGWRFPKAQGPTLVTYDFRFGR